MVLNTVLYVKITLFAFVSSLFDLFYVLKLHSLIPNEYVYLIRLISLKSLDSA